MTPLADLAEEIRAHRASGCGFEPCETCTHMVPGEGAPDARVMIVGEAPGGQEDKAGRPFVGSAGRMLADLLALAGLEREDVFITNVLKARPPKNRNPKVAEVTHHLPWLERQLELVVPEIVVAMGRHALTVFAPDAKISEAHGTEITAQGRRIFALYHPAAALHRPPLRETLKEDAAALGRALSREVAT